ncbi:MAG: putative DNA binding domain-containing protein [Candidatus Sumerlaeota bacterium]|nr:putative DNA binding domain-containing protein [Candidatus Sumerlaeota bacterium]
MQKMIDGLLSKLAELIAQDRFEEMESDTLEIKPVPAEGAQWRELHKSVNAFLNTRGGIVILGVKEEGRGTERRYVFTGYQEQAEPKLKELLQLFTDRKGQALDLTDCFPPMELKPFPGGRVAIVYVDELAADRRFCFYRNEAYRRVLTGDHKISDSKIEAQEEFKEEAFHARELQPVLAATVEDLDLDRLNEYIQQLNRTVRVETIKPDLTAAMPFLERKAFVKAGAVTTLGMLVCGKHPGDFLGFRCQAHGYVDAPQTVAQDKQDLCDNILPLMEGSLAYILRNIQVGVSVAAGGSNQPQYPEELLRETVNNALAHRDYSIDKQVIVTIKPGEHISIQNPGAFRTRLLIETAHEPVLRRIIPEAKPRNPKLADVLRVYRKWEGRGIGMATLVNLCLQNRIDLPYYRLHQDEVRLFLCAGRLLDERMERLFTSFDAYLEQKLNGLEPTETQKLVLAYLIKSEEANRVHRHTILLTPDNNHYDELVGLERCGLIHKHPDSTQFYPIYAVDRTLMTPDYLDELRDVFGATFDAWDPLAKEVLGVVYRFNLYSKIRRVSAKQVSFFLWAQERGAAEDIRAFDAFYRKVRYTFNKLEKEGLVGKIHARGGYLLNETYRQTHLA